jgi:hypothetical protein
LYALTPDGVLHIWDARSGHQTGQLSFPSSSSKFTHCVVTPLSGGQQPIGSTALVAAVDEAQLAHVMEIDTNTLFLAPAGSALEISELLTQVHREQQEVRRSSLEDPPKLSTRIPHSILCQTYLVTGMLPSVPFCGCM